MPQARFVLFTLASLLALAALSPQVSAATYYVSNSTANGWAMGDDSRSTAQAVSTNTPWLTISGAQAKASNGDTIIVNDGIYTENSGSGFLNLDRGLTIQPFTDYGVTIRSTATSRVLNLSAGNADITLGKLIIDGEESRNWGINIGQVGSLTLDGTKISGARAVAILNSDAVNHTRMNNVQIVGTAMSGGGYYNVGTQTGGSLEINGGKINITNLTSGSGGGIVYIGAANGVGVSVSGMTINLTGAGSGYQGIRVANVDRALIAGNIITTNNLSGSCASIWVYASGANFTAHYPTIRDNKIYNNCAGGHTIIHGTDGSTLADNRHNYGEIYHNIVVGSTNSTTLHGIMLGSNLGGRVWGNSVRLTKLALLAKLNVGGLFTDNEVRQVIGGGYGLRSKGATGTEFANNRIYLNAGSGGYGIYVDENPANPTVASTGVVYRNNDVYAQVPGSRFVNVANTNSANTATFIGNRYYLTQESSPGQWVYQGTNYSALASWQAAHEATASLSKSRSNQSLLPQP